MGVGAPNDEMGSYFSHKGAQGEVQLANFYVLYVILSHHDEAKAEFAWFMVRNLCF